jgi:hypothetical protein
LSKISNDVVIFFFRTLRYLNAIISRTHHISV